MARTTTVAEAKLPSRKGLFIACLGIICLLAVRLWTAHSLHWQLSNRWQDFVTLTGSVIIESLPFVLLGIVLSVLVQVWLPESWLRKALPKQPVLRRLALSLFGVFMPVCQCGNLPLARGLMVQGLSVSESLTFLCAAPIINPITILTTWQAFRLDHSVVVARIIVGFVIANIVGWMFSRHANPKSLLTDNFAALCEQPDTHKHSKLTESLEVFIRETNNIMPALFAGALLAGLVQVVVPRTALLSLGANPVWSVLAMMLLAFIISICSTADAFFALAFSSTFTTGSIVSFLTFGPIIDIKMLTLMRTTFRPRVLVQLTALVALLCIIAGLGVNYAF